MTTADPRSTNHQPAATAAQLAPATDGRRGDRRPSHCDEERQRFIQKLCVAPRSRVSYRRSSGRAVSWLRPGSRSSGMEPSPRAGAGIHSREEARPWPRAPDYPVPPCRASLPAGGLRHPRSPRVRVNADQLRRPRSRADCRLGAVGDAEFVEDVGDVFLDCVARDVQLVGDLLVLFAGSEQLQHLPFSVAEHHDQAGGDR